MATSLNRDGMSILEGELPANIYTHSKGKLLDAAATENYGTIASGRKQRNASSSSHIMDQIKQSYTTAGRIRGQTQILGTGPMQPQRLQFYPQNASLPTKKPTSQARGVLNLSTARIVQNLSGSKGSNNFGILHDNSHAPYLGTKHMATTAYL